MANEPTYIDKRGAFMDGTKELADELALPHSAYVDMAAEYWRRKNPADVILTDGERCGYIDNERAAKRLNEVLKQYIEEHGPIQAEGLAPLMLQQSTSKTVDVKSLAEHDPRTLARLLDLGCLRVDMAALEAAEKAGLITGVPKMPIGGTPRLVFDRRR